MQFYNHLQLQEANKIIILKNKKLNQKNLQIISTTDVESFRGSLFLEFEGQTGTGHLVNNEALNNWY